MKKHLISLLVLITGFATAQRTVNDYQYAVVPAKFEFSRDADQYKLNTYTKMYMEKYGFITFMENEVPRELANSNCNKLYVDLIENKTLFTTKLTVVLKDCQNKILFKSDEGLSKEKEFKIAYPQALRQAFNSFNTLNYKYSGAELAVESSQNMPATSNPNMTVKPMANDAAGVVLTGTAAGAKDLLFAQPTANGFQVVDTTPKVILRLKVTSKQDVFIAERESVSGLLFTANGKWIFEYYLQGTLVSETLNIKF